MIIVPRMIVLPIVIIDVIDDSFHLLIHNLNIQRFQTLFRFHVLSCLPMDKRTKYKPSPGERTCKN